MHEELLHDVVQVRHLGGHRLWLRFDDGVEGVADLRQVVRAFENLLAPLAEPEYVAKVRIPRGLGTVAWPNGVDLDPVVLYCAVRGLPVPRFEQPAKRTGGEDR